MKQSNRLISVIIPAYNSAAFIVEALESVFAQTYAPVEVIVVDDGSKDNTAQVLQPFLNRIQYIKKENGGPASARNRGIKDAKGEFIAFLDADDLWLPAKLEMQMKVMEPQPSIGLVGCYEYETTMAQEIIGNEIYRNYFNAEDLTRNLIMRNVVGGGSSALVRRECFNRVGVFDETLRGTEDWDMWFRIAMAFEVRFVEEFLLIARINPGSVSSVKNTRKMLAMELKFLNKTFSDPLYHFNQWQKIKSYSYRYYRSARVAVRNLIKGSN